MWYNGRGGAAWGGCLWGNSSRKGAFCSACISAQPKNARLLNSLVKSSYTGDQPYLQRFPNGECSLVYSMQAITFVGKAKFKKHFVTFCKSSYLSNSNESGSWLKIMT